LKSKGSSIWVGVGPAFCPSFALPHVAPQAKAFPPIGFRGERGAILKMVAFYYLAGHLMTLT